MMVYLNIAPDILEKFPDLRIGIVTVAGMHNGDANAEVEAIKQDAATKLRHDFTSETLTKHPYILAWRETYRQCGVKSSDYRPTAEALMRRIVQGNALPTISTAVDLYLATELAYYLPIGGYDLYHVAGDITLRLSLGNEIFFPIGSAAAEQTTRDEVVYADAEKILTRRWNYRDCDAAKITQNSSHIALFCEAPLVDVPTDHLCQSTEQLATYLRRFCGGTVTTHIVEAKHKARQQITS